MAFGRARPATGFSIDLRGIVTALPPAELGKGILAPNDMDTELLKIIDSLRTQGHVVVTALPGHEAYLNELNCDRKLEKKDGQWQVVNAPTLG